MKDDNDSNVKIMITRHIWIIWTPMSAVRKKVIKLKSLTGMKITVTFMDSLKFVS